MTVYFQANEDQTAAMNAALEPYLAVVDTVIATLAPPEKHRVTLRACLASQILLCALFNGEEVDDFSSLGGFAQGIGSVLATVPEPGGRQAATSNAIANLVAAANSAATIHDTKGSA